MDDISLLFKNFTGEITIDELQSICGSKVDIVNKKSAVMWNLNLEVL